MNNKFFNRKKDKKEEKVVEVQKKYPIVTLKEKGKITLPLHIITQIMYLHSNIGKVEWSGMLLYSIKAGSIAKPEELVIRAEHIFLMDIGSTAYTEYETDGDIVDLYSEVEGAMDMKTGHIHTHHDMSAYFSGTDMSELNDNVDKHNYYLSLIVNFSGNYAAKIAFISTVKTSSLLNYNDDAGKEKVFKRIYEEESMVIIDLSITLEYDFDFFYNRLSQVEKKIEEAENKKEKKWNNNWNDRNDRYNYSNRQLELPPNYDTGDINPQLLTNYQVETLTRNIISVTPDMSETRNVYTLLRILSEKNEKEEADDFAFYHDYLSKNIDNIISNFFDDIAFDEKDLILVLGEVDACMRRFTTMPKILEIVEGIKEVMEGYINFYKSTEEDIKDILDEEIKSLKN